MNKIPRNLRAVLTDKSGMISVSIPDLIVSTIVRTIVVGGLVAAIGVMLWISTSTTVSTKSSAIIQASSVRFDSDVASADIVKGIGADTAALLTTKGTSCAITVWRNATVGTVRNLVADTSTVPGACTQTTVVPASSLARVVLLSNVKPNQFVFTNVAGRVITFDSAGNPSLSADSNPGTISDEDWADLRPQRVDLNVSSLTDKLASFTKNANLVGYARVQNFSEAVTGSKYSDDKPPVIVQASDIGDLSVTRSTTVGDVYTGVREGARVSFFGGICQDLPSYVTLTWTTNSPSGIPAESASLSRVMDGTPTVFEMPRVRNGADGVMEVAVKCKLDAVPSTNDTPYTQPVPATTVTVQNGTSPDQHIVSWTPISSLPSQFNVTWKSTRSTPNPSGSVPTTSGLTTTVNHAAGTNYGFSATYTVTPIVGSASTVPSSASISTPWPAVPGAQSIAYTPTGSGSRITDGTLNWGYSTGCPSGTTLFSREIQNVVFDQNARQYVGNYTIGSFAANKTSVIWNPSYALEGYKYGEKVDTYCSSAATGAVSPVTSSQSPYFYTRMNSPVAPAWNGFDFRDWQRGDTVGFGTCWNIQPTTCSTNFPQGNAVNGGGFYESYQMDYAYACSSGSSLSWSYYRTEKVEAPYGGNDRGYFGKQDGWQMGDSTDTFHYSHNRPVYKCSTPWVTSPTSATGADLYYTLNRIWR